MLVVDAGVMAKEYLQKVAIGAGFNSLASEIDRLGPLTLALPHYSTVADQLYVEVINQQLSMKAADTIWKRVVAAAEDAGMATPELFAPGFETKLRACGVSGRKAKTLQAIREADKNGLLEREELRALPHPKRSERLCTIWGIGKWTADMIGIFHFLDPDIWPEGDVAAVGGLRRLTGCSDTIAAAEPFAPYRSYLARYMWLSRDNPAGG